MTFLTRRLSITFTIVLVAFTLPACSEEVGVVSPFDAEASFARNAAAGTNGQGSVAIDPDHALLSEGDEIQLSGVAVNPAGRPARGQSIRWASEDPDIATVDETGLVLAVAPGTTWIVATSASGWTGSAEITVSGCDKTVKKKLDCRKKAAKPVYRKKP